MKERFESSQERNLEENRMGSEEAHEYANMMRAEAGVEPGMGIPYPIEGEGG